MTPLIASHPLLIGATPGGLNRGCDNLERMRPQGTAAGTAPQLSAVERGPGTYALVLHAAEERSMEIGRLGRLDLRCGFYVYVGSAFGPGGLRARLRHHLRPATRPHWHVDYLRAETRLVEIWYSRDEAVREHAWADAIRQMRSASTPLPGFGSSDCRCPSHLSFHPERPTRSSLRRALRRLLPRRAVLHRIDGAECVGAPGAG
jgi:Uri superfamily endonuclease